MNWPVFGLVGPADSWQRFYVHLKIEHFKRELFFSIFGTLGSLSIHSKVNISAPNKKKKDPPPPNSPQTLSRPLGPSPSWRIPPPGNFNKKSTPLLRTPTSSSPMRKIKISETSTQESNFAWKITLAFCSCWCLVLTHMLCWGWGPLSWIALPPLDLNILSKQLASTQRGHAMPADLP